MSYADDVSHSAKHWLAPDNTLRVVVPTKSYESGLDRLRIAAVGRTLARPPTDGHFRGERRIGDKKEYKASAQSALTAEGEH